MRTVKYLVLVLVSFLSTSCMITESVVFDADASGKIKYKFDMSQVMAMAGDQFGGAGEGVEGASRPKELMDSTFTFKELYAGKQDSIANLPAAQQHKLKQIEKFSMRMIMDEANKTFVYEMFADFKSPSELQEMVSPINGMSEFNPMGKTLPVDGTPKNDGITRYAFDGKNFSKAVTLKSKEAIAEEMQRGLSKVLDSSESDELAGQMTEAMDMLFQQSTYDMVVTFPRKVKKVSVANAQLSEDGKTVTITYPMENYMKSIDMNFEVELED